MFVWSPAHRHRPARETRARARRIHRRTPQLSDDLNATVAARFPQLPPAPSTTRSWKTPTASSTSRPPSIGTTSAPGSPSPNTSQAYGDENRANEAITELDSENNIVFNARPGSRIALLGVDDLIIVQTEDALLIANRHQADAIKNLSPLLPPELL